MRTAYTQKKNQTKQTRRLPKCVACPLRITLVATAQERVLAVRVPAIVLCRVVGGGGGGESLLMQGSSCYCDALSCSRALPAALSQPVPNIHIAHTRAHKHTRMHTDCKGSGSPRLKTAGEIRGDGVCVCVCVRGMGGVCVCVRVRWTCPFQFAFLLARARLCKEADLLLQLEAKPS